MKINSLIILCMFFTGCASIMSGTTQQVTFQSTPDGALVSIDGKPIGKTPLTIQLDKKNGQVLTIEKDGYKSFKTSMDTRLDPWFWGNIVLGGVIGSTTDGANGSVHEYSQGQYFITLEQIVATNMEGQTTFSPYEAKKSFLFINYKNIKNDLAQKKGEYLDSTLEILGVDNVQRTEAVKDLSSRIFSTHDANTFILQTLDKYRSS